MSLIEEIDLALSPIHRFEERPYGVVGSIAPVSTLIDLLQKCREQLRWVPVAERKPENYQLVLVTNKSYMGVGIRKLCDGEWYDEHGRCTNNIKNEPECPSYWLPIDPPQGE